MTRKQWWRWVIGREHYGDLEARRDSGTTVCPELIDGLVSTTEDENGV
jgi:hypothetical protein